MEEIRIHRNLSVPLNELEFSFARSGGPGGQNVNKVESKVVLRFDLAGSRSIAPTDRQRLRHKLQNRLTKTGALVLHCDEFRDRERNRERVIERFRSLLAEALRRPRQRIATKPSRAQRERRLQLKRQRGERKRLRRGADL